MTMTLNGSGTGTVGVPNSATAQNATGTAIDFTGIPAGIKRITVMFNGVSTNGTSNYLVQIGAGSITTSGYVSAGGQAYSSGGGFVSSTAGFIIQAGQAAAVCNGTLQIYLQTSNAYTSSHTIGNTGGSNILFGGGSVTLSGALDRVRITTVNGTDTFDAGSINILYE